MTQRQQNGSRPKLVWFENGGTSTSSANHVLDYWTFLLPLFEIYTNNDPKRLQSIQYVESTMLNRIAATSRGRGQQSEFLGSSANNKMGSELIRSSFRAKEHKKMTKTILPQRKQRVPILTLPDHKPASRDRTNKVARERERITRSPGRSRRQQPPDLLFTLGGLCDKR
jgi:hypothetical protein